MKQLTTKQKHILNIIRANEGVQNSDIRLLEAVWKAEGWQDDKSLYWNLSRVTSSETVTRCRRYLFEKGYIAYNKVTEEKRYKQYITMRNEYGEEITVLG